MLTVRYHSEVATPGLLARLRELVRYDSEGRFSSYLVDNTPLPPELAKVVSAIYPESAPSVFCGVILQAYAHGQAVTPCHADATGFGFILSLGATRTLRLHRVPAGTDPLAGCGDYGLDVAKIECASGTVVVMDREFHSGWHHQIVPDKDTGERLSLVFRRM